MAGEARLEETATGLAPGGEGWFVVNVRDAAWTVRPDFAATCRFEGREAAFPELGIGIRVIEPGRANGLYHRESAQEDFLVLSGECLLLIDGEERRLRAWDFVHCPAGTDHIFVGAGDEPCAILMVGARPERRTVVYPVSELARKHGAGVEKEASSPAEAYAAYAGHRPGRPARWDELPWA